LWYIVSQKRLGQIHGFGRLPDITEIIGRKWNIIIKWMELVSIRKFFNRNFIKLEIYRYDMYTTGAGTKRTTILLFIFMFGVIACLCYWALKIIIAYNCFCTGYTRQDQQIYTENEDNDFHFANIVVLYVFFQSLMSQVVTRLVRNSLLLIPPKRSTT